ncbi:MAG: VWA domain-containing protein [Candidatus Competibacteraceae bacterium]|nr:VWA domain-containing protein [Candidatus Competibacteraceae bacterium]
MRLRRFLTGSLCLLLVAGLQTLAAHAAPGAQPWSAVVHCSWDPPKLRCRFRPLGAVAIQRVELAVDGAPPQVIGWQPFASDGATSAMLWLVDVSNPARAATVARQQQLLKQWVTTLRPWQRVGLAVFAEELTLLAPLDSAPTTVSEALDRLVARGHSTAFYRSLLDGIALLARVEGERKSLWVFSDAMAEDTAYRYDDVLQAAQAAGIIIIGLGYPERDSQRPALQRLHG